MGHYASEMGVPLGYDAALSNAAYAAQDELEAFWGKGLQNLCPICGVTVKWDFLDARPALTHAAWHARMGQYVARTSSDSGAS